MRELTPEQEERIRERATKHVGGVVSKLSAMQRAFLIEYLVTSNATEAARTAGYSTPEKAGSRVLSYDKIQEAISEYFFGPEMGAAEVIQRLGQQGRAEYADYFVEREVPVLDKDGELVGHQYAVDLDFERLLADGKGHLVKGVSYTRTGQMVVSFHDAQSALVHIGRYHGIFKDTAVNLNVDLSDLSDEELDELRKRL